VRLTNLGYTSVEIAHTVRLPDHCDDDHLTSEFYGVAEHHVRQIRTGLFGFFDGDEAQLFPLPAGDRADRMLAGFGGRDTVRQLATDAIESDDLRWALELCSWLVRSDGVNPRTAADGVLRTVAQRTSAANIRNWCLTRARQLDGSLDGSRFRVHRLQRARVIADPIANVHVMRVMLDPLEAEGLDTRISWHFAGAGTTGLHVRHSIACVYDGAAADATVHCTADAWADVVAGNATLSAAIAGGAVRIDGDAAAATRALHCFDIAGLRS
jgi:alkyl sulfatase BDS1-like metallo-beta-lactamase superfamily hydrolase